jgi:hypothetical protein
MQKIEGEPSPFNLYDRDDITKFTIAVSNEKIYGIILKYPPRLLRLNIEEGKIIDEQILT